MFNIGMEQMKIEGEPIDNVGVTSRGAWDMPYSGTFNPNSSPMPFNYPGEPPRYLFDKDESGSGKFLFRHINSFLEFICKFYNNAIFLVL